MPELPEVETVARGLKWAEGQVLQKIEIIDDRVWFESELSANKFKNLQLTGVSRRGKYIILRFNNGSAIVQHLRMTGKMLDAQSKLIPQEVAAQVSKKRGKGLQVRASFQFQKKKIYFFDTRRFGTLTAIKNEEEFFSSKKIAPDPFHDSVKAKKHFLDKIKSTTKNAKAALLDQSIVAGVGNIYADEALFVQKIAPQKSAKKIKAPEKLWESIIEILLNSMNSGGSSIINYVGADGERGTFSSSLKAYGRDGEPCFVCSTKLRKVQLAGRSTHFCPTCQR